MSRSPKTSNGVSVPKVKALMDSQERIQEFKARNYETFRDFDSLLEDYNQKLEDAEVEIRALGVSCGPFQVIGTQINVDADRLYDELGRDEFLRVGGQITTKVVTSVDKTRLKAYIDSKTIPEEVAKACWEEKPRLKAPKKAEIP